MSGQTLDTTRRHHFACPLSNVISSNERTAHRAAEQAIEGCDVHNYQVRYLEHTRKTWCLEEAEEDVGVDGALVCLIEHDDGVGRQGVVQQCLAQQHPIRHVFDHRLRAGAVLKPDCVAHLRSIPFRSSQFAD